MFSWYGFLIGLAFVVTVQIMEHILHRSTTIKLSDATLITGTLLVGGLGLAGARIYHLLTDWQLYQNLPLSELFIAMISLHRGGLGIFGGMVGGVIGIIIWKKLFLPDLSTWALLDAVAIAAPFGHAIGRLGNYVNQEVFGPPTDAFWGIFIQPENRPEQFINATHFHPLFFYEGAFLFLLGSAFLFTWRWGQKNLSQPFWKVGSGLWLALYAISYGTVRLSLDFLRWDMTPATLGLTWSQWMGVLTIIVGVGILLRMSHHIQQSFMKISGVVLALSIGWSLFGIGDIELIPSAAAQAPQNQIELGIEPSVMQIALQPGKQITQAVTLSNSSSIDLEVLVTLVDFSADGQSGNPILHETSTFPYAELRNADRQFGEPFVLPANQNQQLVVGVAVPEDAIEKDWYFTLLAQTKPSQGTLPTSQMAARATGTIGANFLVTVRTQEPGAVPWQIQLGPLPRFLDSFQQLPIPVTVENQGQHVALTEMSVVVLNWKNEIVYQADGLPDRVLANSRRQVLTGQPSREDPRSLEPTEFLFDPLFAAGPYTVRATVRNAAEEPVITQETVYAVPFVLVAAIVGTGAIILILTTTKKRRVQQLAAKSRHSTPHQQD